MHHDVDSYLIELSDRDWDLDRHGYTVNPENRALSSARSRGTTGAATTSEPGGGPEQLARTNPHEGPENPPRLERGQPVSGISTGTPAPAAAEPAGANLHDRCEYAARLLRDIADSDLVPLPLAANLNLLAWRLEDSGRW